MKKIFVILLAAFAITTCKDKPTEPPPPVPNITGTWQGKGMKSGISYTVTVALIQTSGDTLITGNGEISALVVRIPFSVLGGNNYPDVRMTFSNPDPSFGTGTYIGKFESGNDNAINGAATVPAFGITNESLRIERIK